MRTLTRAVILLLILAGGSGVFAYWGLFTEHGSRRFDEMVGMIPFFAAVASGIFLLTAVSAGLLSLRAKFGTARKYHAAVMAALRRDDRPLRAAYERVAHTTVADLRDRLAEPADHDRRAWPTYEDYWRMVMRSQRHNHRESRRLLWQRKTDVLECGWWFAGLDFAEVITREQDGRVHQIEFVTAADPTARLLVDVP
jgi:hypothetical protein